MRLFILFWRNGSSQINHRVHRALRLFSVYSELSVVSKPEDYQSSKIPINIHPYLLVVMNDYWGVPEKEYEISLMQFARQPLSDSSYSVLEEKVEVCSGAGALTLTAIIKTGCELIGLYIHDGPRQRKKRGSPIIRVLRLLPEIKNVENLRKFIIMHQDDFHIILEHENRDLRDKAELELLQIYSNLYDSKIRDLYENDLSSAADVLRVRLRKESQGLYGFYHLD